MALPRLRAASLPPIYTFSLPPLRAVMLFDILWLPLQPQRPHANGQLHEVVNALDCPLRTLPGVAPDIHAVTANQNGAGFWIRLHARRHGSGQVLLEVGVFNDRDDESVAKAQRRLRGIISNPFDHFDMRNSKLFFAKQTDQNAVLGVRMQAGTGAAQMVGVEEERRAFGYFERLAHRRCRWSLHDGLLIIQDKDFVWLNALLLHSTWGDKISITHFDRDAAAGTGCPAQLVEISA